jgi:hypothetical protein
MLYSKNLNHTTHKRYHPLELIQERKSSSDGERRMVTGDGVGCQIKEDLVVVEPENEDLAVVEPKNEDLAVIEPKKKNLIIVEPKVERNEPKGDRTQTQGESIYGEVYVRRKKQNEKVVSTVSLVLSPLPLPTPTLETPTSSISDSEYTGDMIPLNTPPLHYR